MRASARLRSVMSTAAISTAGTPLIGQPAGEDRHVDEAAVGLAMPPGAAGLPVLRRIGDVGDLVGLATGSWISRQGAGGERGAVVAIMGDRGVVGRQDALAVDGADEHRHRVLESNSRRNEASRCFISVMSTRRPMMPPSLVLRSSISTTRPSESTCSCGAPGLRIKVEPLGDPLLLAAEGRRIVAARHADAQRVLELDADFEEVGAALVDVGVLLVPQDVASLAVEEDDALRQNVDRFAQAPFRRLRVAHRSGVVD